MNNRLLEINDLTVDDLKKKDDKLEMLADLISISTVTSDKLGYDWEVIKLGDMEIKKTYVKREEAKGTADNPYTDKSVLVNNAYYMIDGVRYVYMDGQFIEF